MTLLVTIFAAVISTIYWYKSEDRDNLKISTLVFMYWGAALMWSVDAVFEYIELGREYFTPNPMDMLNDFFLGLSVVALGLVIWVVTLLIKDPKGIIRKKLIK